MKKFDASIPRLVKIHEILRDKKKPYTKFSHFEIMKGDDMIGISTQVLQEDLKFKGLNHKPRLKIKGEEEAKSVLDQILSVWE